MMHARIDDTKTFKAWLIKRGAVIEGATNEWEILRVRTCEGLHVAYRNKADQIVPALQAARGEPMEAEHDAD